MLMYQSSLSRSAACKSEIVALLIAGELAGKPTCTPAFTPGAAGPWKWETVSVPVSPLQVMLQESKLLTLSGS